MLSDFLPPIDPKKIEEIDRRLGEVPERVTNNVRLLEEWMKFQTHLPQNYDRVILQSYLRGCKQNLDKAKKKIETFFIAKDTQLDLYGNIDTSFEGDLSVCKYKNIAILPELSPEGYRITIIQLANSDVSSFEIHKVVRYVTMLATMRIHHDEHQVAGEIIILDVRKASSQHVTKFLCNLTRKSIELIQTATPLILKQIHVITELGIVVKAVGIVKQFFKEKMRERFHVSSEPETLVKHIPLKCLPEEYGGNLKSIKEYSDQLYKYVNECDFFDRLETMKIRGEIPKHSTITLSNEDFGIDGSFRKLNLD